MVTEHSAIAEKDGIVHEDDRQNPLKSALSKVRTPANGKASTVEEIGLANLNVPIEFWGKVVNQNR